MSFHFNEYSTPLLFGFVQGWLYAMLLWNRAWREERLSDALLGGVLVGLCFNIWEYMLGFGGVEVLWRQLEFFPRSPGLLLPPLCYFYLKSQLDAGFRFSKRDLLHAVPFLLDAGHHAVVFAQGAAFVEWWKQTVHYPLHVADLTAAASLFSSLYYLRRALRLYRQYRSWTTTQFSDPDTVSFRWFRNFIVALSSGLVFGLVMDGLDLWLDLNYWQDWWDDLYGAALIYYVSITGYAQAQPRRLTFSPPAAPQAAPAGVEPQGETTHQRPVEVLEGELAAWKRQVLDLMEAEKPYLAADLSLPDLARRLGMPVTLLSQVINEGTGKHFNDFINAYRVAEFLRQAQEPANAHLSLLGIALNSGFNSKSTFNRAFKKVTGTSPKEYLDRRKSPAREPVNA
ncbi:MAG: Transcriptional regulator, AraC family [uncultured Cytophagales bacterium]|uniref:Transcriptional regulator, AraC family n=1 Tax=uncultured Cytophagales bacterium TaxID=158755 RepID=A0A6J4JE67_9SPHI|nr:MAG: Transcriptional regulator, AraC family [uncultured Cytophagales bacterium]